MRAAAQNTPRSRAWLATREPPRDRKQHFLPRPSRQTTHRAFRRHDALPTRQSGAKGANSYHPNPQFDGECPPLWFSLTLLGLGIAYSRAAVRLTPVPFCVSPVSSFAAGSEGVCSHGEKPESLNSSLARRHRLRRRKGWAI